MAPGRWSGGAKPHTQEGPGQDQPAIMDQGGVRAREEDKLGGLPWLSASVL